MDTTNTVNTEDTKDTKITSVEKEKVKDPRRVAQGKKLAAISREAKERKAREREAARQTQLKEEQETNASYVSYALIPVIGIAFGGYYFLCLRNPTNTQEEDRKDREDQEPKKKEPNLEKL